MFIGLIHFEALKAVLYKLSCEISPLAWLGKRRVNISLLIAWVIHYLSTYSVSGIFWRDFQVIACIKSVLCNLKSIHNFCAYRFHGRMEHTTCTFENISQFLRYWWLNSKRLTDADVNAFPSSPTSCAESIAPFDFATITCMYLEYLPCTKNFHTKDNIYFINCLLLIRPAKL